jgi:hypothetical protein
METAVANSIFAKSYVDPNDLAMELVRFFNGGLNLGTLNLSSIDGRYARLEADNEFVGNNQLQGKTTLFGAADTGNLLSMTHAGTGSGESKRGLYLEATAGAGAATFKRNLGSGVTDHLVTMTENASAFNVLNISSAGSASAVYIAHTGSGGFGLEVNARGIRINNGGLTISAGGLTVTAGSSSFGAAVTITSGGLNVTSGGASVTGGLTVTSAGLAVNAGGASITGGSSFSSTLSIGGLLTASAGIAVTGNISGVTTLTATTVNATNLTVSGATISVNGFTFQTNQINYKDHSDVNQTARVLVV